MDAGQISGLIVAVVLGVFMLFAFGMAIRDKIRDRRKYANRDAKYTDMNVGAEVTTTDDTAIGGGIAQQQRLLTTTGTGTGLHLLTPPGCNSRR